MNVCPKYKVGSTVASPAIVQAQPALKWRMVTSYAKSLDTRDGGCRMVSKIVSDLTDRQFQIDVFAAGELAPALGVVVAVQNGTVEMGHSASYYCVGKDPALAPPATQTEFRSSKGPSRSDEAGDSKWGYSE